MAHYDGFVESAAANAAVESKRKADKSTDSLRPLASIRVSWDLELRLENKRLREENVQLRARGETLSRLHDRLAGENHELRMRELDRLAGETW